MLSQGIRASEDERVRHSIRPKPSEFVRDCYRIVDEVIINDQAPTHLYKRKGKFLLRKQRSNPFSSRIRGLYRKKHEEMN